MPATVPMLYAHALALERDAVQRYRAYGKYMHELGVDYLADVFAELEGEESAQIEALEEGARGCTLPQLSPADYELLFDAAGSALAAFPPVPVSTRDALGLALAAEQRAERYYSEVSCAAADPLVRVLAAAMASDEHRHVSLIEQALEREDKPAPVRES